MSTHASQINITPGKRRTMPKSKGKSGSHKTYASENDMSTIESTMHWQPQTPEKPTSPAHTGRGQQNCSTGKTPKLQTDSKKKKNNSDNHHSSSPEPDRLSRAQVTTPQRAASARSGLPAAFAGATFHASPAPSALPMPSFFVKSPSGALPAQAAATEDSDAPPQQLTPPASEKGAFTPKSQQFQAFSSESPLDFIFRAHRQESQRQRANLDGPPETPPSQNPQCPPNTFPKASVQPNSHPSPYRRYSSGIDMEEFDGAPKQPVGPSFATPYQDRLKAYRNSNNSHNGTQQQQHPRTLDANTDNPSEALKRFLFQGKPNPKGLDYSPNPYPPSYNAISTQPIPGYAGFSNASQQNDHKNVQAMENDLRRILKLDVQ